ncbi:hypothetical protein ACYSNR_07195 [Enterococcus sp. LJL128]
MKRTISKKAVVIRFGLLGWKLYTKNEMKFAGNPGYIFRLYACSFLVFFSLIVMLALLVSVKVWLFLELFLLLLSCWYGLWASKFFAQYF